MLRKNACSSSSAAVASAGRYDTNTILHTLILANNIDGAVAVIKADSARPDGESIINVSSLSNTPLLLALKVGAIRIAEAILTHPHVDVHAVDCRGLTALHWACMLRQDAIIATLLDKKANPHHETSFWSRPYVPMHPMTPSCLYREEVEYDAFYQYCLADTMARQKMTNLSGIYSNKIYFPLFFFKSMGEYRLNIRSGFCDREDLYIPGARAYTDLIFHMGDLCTNMGWTDPMPEPWNEIWTEDDNRCLSSQDRFKHNFMAGMESFCKNRNAIPPNKELLERMDALAVKADLNIMSFRSR